MRHKVNGLTIRVYEQDAYEYELPSLARHPSGSCAPSTLLVRVTPDGMLARPETSGLGSEQRPENLYRLEPSGPLRGWGALDCKGSYEIVGSGHVVPAPVIHKMIELCLIKWSQTEATK